MNSRIELNTMVYRSEKDTEEGLRCMCGAPTIHPNDIREAWKKFQGKALPVMQQWVTTPHSEVQYADLMKQLEDYALPHAHEGLFCRNILLPSLKDNGTIAKVDDRMLAILYTMGLSCDWKELLEGLESKADRSAMTFSVKFKLGSGCLGISDYEISNYLDPSRATIRQLGTKSGDGQADSALISRAIKA